MGGTRAHTITIYDCYFHYIPFIRSIHSSENKEKSCLWLFYLLFTVATIVICIYTHLLRNCSYPPENHKKRKDAYLFMQKNKNIQTMFFVCKIYYVNVLLVDLQNIIVYRICFSIASTSTEYKY